MSYYLLLADVVIALVGIELTLREIFVVKPSRHHRFPVPLLGAFMLSIAGCALPFIMYHVLVDLGLAPQAIFLPATIVACVLLAMVFAVAFISRIERFNRAPGGMVLIASGGFYAAYFAGILAGLSHLALISVG